MVRRVTTRVLMYDEVMYQRGGIVHNWMRDVRRDMVFFAKSEAPVRTGALRAGIHGQVRTTGQRSVRLWLYSQAEHTDWVLFGTANKGTGWIRSTRATNYKGTGPAELAVGRDSAWPPTIYREQVRGQKPNNFIRRAVGLTRQRHPALGGVNPVRQFGR